VSVRIIIADVLAGLAQLEPESVHCVVTSPPYWGLRDYGVAGQIGLERTLTEYVGRMVEVFSAVRRVLRRDGTLWLNLGDSYNGYPGGATTGGPLSNKNQHARASRPTGYGLSADGLKPKDLVGVPWRVAFALQAAGWWLRSDLIWAKPNPMPESVQDRPTRSHEYLFLMAQSERYYYDQEAISEPVAEGTAARLDRAHAAYQAPGQPPHNGTAGPRPNRNRTYPDTMKGSAPAPQIEEDPDAFSGLRNRRTVWTIPTMGYSEAHFATFPPALVEPCILAGTSERGCCSACGAPWRRDLEVSYRHHNNTAPRNPGGGVAITPGAERSGAVLIRDAKTSGWSPGCDCGAEVVPCVVLDPFAGAGTTGLVADRLGRSFVGIELNPEYARLAERRLRGDCPLFCDPILTRGDEK
jgi:DNA modification methylase